MGLQAVVVSLEAERHLPPYARPVDRAAEADHALLGREPFIAIPAFSAAIDAAPILYAQPIFSSAERATKGLHCCTATDDG